MSHIWHTSQTGGGWLRAANAGPAGSLAGPERGAALLGRRPQ
jgi:hypothetical protein